MRAVPKLCPCTSGRPYAACCAPLHRAEREAESPQVLVRARYAAFATGDAEYLWRTLHPDHEDRARDRGEVQRSIEATARALRFMRLTILEARDARVLFLAGVFDRGRDRSFAELSTFGRDGAAWRYRAGEALWQVDAKVASGWTFESFETAMRSRTPAD